MGATGTGSWLRCASRICPSRCWKLCAAGLLAVSEAASGQEGDETPLALVLSANAAAEGASSGPHLLRTGAALPLSARPGEMLFAGDALRAEGGSIIFLSCTANSQQTPAGRQFHGSALPPVGPD